jgi:hypothetical protein
MKLFNQLLILILAFAFLSLSLKLLFFFSTEHLQSLTTFSSSNSNNCPKTQQQTCPLCEPCQQESCKSCPVCKECETTRKKDLRELQAWHTKPETEEDLKLERILLRAAQKAPEGFPNTVILLLCNSGFHEMLVNFLHHAHRTVPPVYNYVVFPLDEPEFRNLTIDHPYLIPSMYYDDANFSPRPRNFRSFPYNEIVNHKFFLAEKVMRFGFTPFVVDVDNVFLRNPYNFLVDMPKCDFSAVTDSITSDIKHESEFRWNARGHQVYINTGFILWKNSEHMLRVLQEVITMSKQERDIDDQEFFCRILTRNLLENAKEQDEWKRNLVNVPIFQRHLRCSNLGGITANILPPGLFGGQRIVIQSFKLAEAQMTPPFVIHYGHLAGFYEKRNFMNLTGFWNLTTP